jgi:hypothetical protein
MAYQVKLSPTGQWHRRALDESGTDNGHTACGLSIDGAYLSREGILDDRLCSICFTDLERDTGEMKRIEMHALEAKRAGDLVDRWAVEDGLADEEITDEHEPTGEHTSVPRAVQVTQASGEIDTDTKKGT